MMVAKGKDQIFFVARHHGLGYVVYLLFCHILFIFQTIPSHYPIADIISRWRQATVPTFGHMVAQNEGVVYWEMEEEI